MTRKYSPEENHLIEKAICFFVDEYRKSGNNPKPVIFHSLRVAFKLTEYNANASAVAAAVLHDLLEDSDVSEDQIEEKFGKEIRNIVSAVSFKPEISDKNQQFKEMFKRVVAAGKPAMEIKCVDILDNSDYYEFGNNKDSETILINKLDYFLEITKSHINDYRGYKDLAVKAGLLHKDFDKAYDL